LALLRRLEDHAVRFGNPALTGSEPAVQAFAYDVWYGEWREKLVKRNEPVTMALIALVKYWRDQVVPPDALRHELVRKFKNAEAAKRKDPLLKPSPSRGFGFTPAPNGFSFTERVEPSPTGQPDKVTWTVAVIDDELQVSAGIATYTGGCPRFARRISRTRTSGSARCRRTRISVAPPASSPTHS
jgi:hypothetical protein